MNELDEQERVHRAIEHVLELREGHVLTGWVLLHETLGPDGATTAGHLYGPAGMTDWRALGLCEWAARFTIPPDADPDDDEAT
ncbi:MAG TPA: hypothetical protein VH834_11050 [Solirubrobacteraceae bacterium]|jgi:hypothetical protein